MPDTDDGVLATIRRLAEDAQAQPNVPAPVAEALAKIAALAKRQAGDTPEASDVSHTDNQTL